jgi:hypothetical protein
MEHGVRELSGGEAERSVARRLTLTHNGNSGQNPYNSDTINSVSGKKDANGTTTIQLGDCDGNIPNCIPIMKGWNYTVRLYRPPKKILDGMWKFPEPQRVK